MSSDHLIDVSKIPKLSFQVHNEELTSCIKQLHFQSKTHDKHIQKIKKDIDQRPTNTNLIDSFALISSNIQIDAAVAKHMAQRTQSKNQQDNLNTASQSLGIKIGQIAQISKILFQKMQQLQKRLDNSLADSKSLVIDKFQNLQSQVDDFKKTQNKQNRSTSQNLQLNINKYEQKLRQVQSKTIWQINDCKTKLNDRVNEQFVRDIVKQTQAKITTKVKESLVKNNIDPQRIDKLQSKSSKIQKQIQIKLVQATSKLNQFKGQIQHTIATKKEIANDRLENQKKIGNLQIQTAELNRKTRNIEGDIKEVKEDINIQTNRHQQSSKELTKVGRMVANLKISDDFQKLMQNLDPHKICQIDNTLTSLAQRDLKIEKEIESMKRTDEKFRQKVQICHMLNPTDSKGKLDKEQISKIFVDLLSANTHIKKIQSIEGQLYEFRAHGDMINDINKKIAKVQKQFDIQGVMYGLKGLEQYIKKELLVVNTKLTMLEGGLAQQKKRRPLSAHKTEGKMTSSLSFKKLVPVDCISCFQNPIGEQSSDKRKLFANKL